MSTRGYRRHHSPTRSHRPYGVTQAVREALGSHAAEIEQWQASHTDTLVALCLGGDSKATVALEEPCGSRIVEARWTR